MIEDPWGQYDQEPLLRLAEITHIDINKLSDDFKVDLLKICQGPSINRIFSLVMNIASTQEFSILQEEDIPVFLNVEECIQLIQDAVRVWIENKGFNNEKIQRELEQFCYAVNLDYGIKEYYMKGVEHGKEIHTLFHSPPIY